MNKYLWNQLQENLMHFSQMRIPLTSSNSLKYRWKIKSTRLGNVLFLSQIRDLFGDHLAVGLKEQV